MYRKHASIAQMVDGLTSSWKRENSVYKHQYFWDVFLRGNVLTRVTSQCDRASACASSTVCLTNRVFSQNTLFLNLSISSLIMWLSRIGFLAGFEHWFQISTLRFFMQKHTNALIHLHMYSHSNPVTWNKKAASLSCLQKFIHFSGARFGRAQLLMKAWLRFVLWPHSGWSIC